ncbi:MAG: polyprenol monophosphomannose synthase [Acidobacteriota bacterium]|nr:polyprenol monophosphomannose synthase [Acidobacteriota bacterium]MDE3092286.1 polyprenol monophosphomannose synthase [Acidobacteriota bacterium]MDE3146088.1 polyprenol monophosphomannose synthase [Acidobacteriota bacterium]
MRLLVVLPTYNEVLNVETMLRTLRSVAPDADVLVVDDASPDKTADAAERAGAELGRVTVLRRRGKGGLGSAYRAGFSWGIDHGYDTFVEIDCDFSHDPAALPSLLAAAERYEVVIGSRYVPGGHIPQWTLSRRLLSRGGNQYASLMLGLGVADSTAGYRVYSRSALEKIDYQSVRADGYGFQIEMTYRARRGGATITEVPISFGDRLRGESKMSSNIVYEALWLVTKWGLQRPLQRRRSAG